MLRKLTDAWTSPKAGELWNTEPISGAGKTTRPKQGRISGRKEGARNAGTKAVTGTQEWLFATNWTNKTKKSKKASSFYTLGIVSGHLVEILSIAWMYQRSFGFLQLIYSHEKKTKLGDTFLIKNLIIGVIFKREREQPTENLVLSPIKSLINFYLFKKLGTREGMENIHT